jgi:hypothetical protein
MRPIGLMYCGITSFAIVKVAAYINATRNKEP